MANDLGYIATQTQILQYKFSFTRSPNHLVRDKCDIEIISFKTTYTDRCFLFRIQFYYSQLAIIRQYTYKFSHTFESRHNTIRCKLKQQYGQNAIILHPTCTVYSLLTEGTINLLFWTVERVKQADRNQVRKRIIKFRQRHKHIFLIKHRSKSNLFSSIFSEFIFLLKRVTVSSLINFNQGQTSPRHATSVTVNFLTSYYHRR